MRTKRLTIKQRGIYATTPLQCSFLNAGIDFLGSNLTGLRPILRTQRLLAISGLNC
jgi:hypothetical protein